MRHLLGIEHMSREEIERILETAEAMLEISQREIKRVPTLRGRTVINMFLEPSTRTRVSFEIAAKRLSADAVNVSAAGSSLQKSETLADMARNLAAMNADVLVVRDRTAGVPRMLADRVRLTVVMAARSRSWATSSTAGSRAPRSTRSRSSVPRFGSPVHPR